MSKYIILSFLLLWQMDELLSNHIILDVSFPSFVTRQTRVNPDSLTDIQLEPVDFNLAEIFISNSTGFNLRMMSDFIIAQHKGGGKPQQIFMRGFEINPGTDIRIRIDGNPIRMMSRATVNTAMDLHFLIPELFYSSGKIELDFSLETILGAVWDETQFEAESSFVSDTEPFLELHYTSEIPCYVKCSGTYYF